ncbi:TPA: hypothetical protein QIB43_003476 [Escherichia coli]|nr:hypothetical protein [Escherichia coli]
MHAYLHCLSHSPLVGYVDPAQEVLDEVNGVIASARERIAAFSPELVVLFAPDHYNGFFYDVMPPFCLGVGATAIGDFGSAAGELPVPVELAKADAHMRDRLLGSGKDLPASERELRQQRVISAAEKFVEDQRTLHPLNPIWDNQFMTLLEQGRIQELDAVSNEELSAIAGKSTHEIKTWVAAFAAISAFGNWRSEGRYYRPIPEWIAGFGSLSARTEN